MEWDGKTERRHDMGDIVSRLVKLETLQERDISEASEWRKRFCDKIDNLTLLLTNLPCDKNEGKRMAMGGQIKGLWIAVTIIMAMLTGVTFALIAKVLK